ncbi:DUF3861 domain-containing protein [Sphingobacterium oryzagri]|uniref:DUF3861 domain-containing protein n=1 Tax=Sphingobacterium oryzagri TaxID=3025669 RepID=A0ABY7WE50_9SPHI|nr:DUF3861 domain-containing protein [Sphingobacterium sp. KACC 22765]WDF67155.1 DUF3861 domain-containing protein [Sphingobacterium sp. KACC 22765]
MKRYKYSLKLEAVSDKEGNPAAGQIEFEFENHDDIFQLIEKTKDSDRFSDAKDNIEFMIGLKLFSEVLLKNRDNELFSDFHGPFRDFMGKLKKSR